MTSIGVGEAEDRLAAACFADGWRSPGFLRTSGVRGSTRALPLRGQGKV
jgi:hypothetical protein